MLENFSRPAQSRSSETIMRMLHILAGLLLCGFFTGCATATHFTPVTNIPPDKALVYLYRRPSQFQGGAVSHQIYVNQKLITVIYNDDYYPYLATPGEVQFVALEKDLGEFALMNFSHSKFNIGQINVEAGKIYYLRFVQAYWKKESNNTSRPLFIQVDNETGEREITNCVLAVNLETNLDAK